MPKATLTFDLPEENEEYRFANNGLKYYCVIFEYLEWLRSDSVQCAEPPITAEAARERLVDMLIEEGLGDGI